jgi:hypothetical protein
VRTDISFSAVNDGPEELVKINSSSVAEFTPIAYKDAGGLITVGKLYLWMPELPEPGLRTLSINIGEDVYVHNPATGYTGPLSGQSTSSSTRGRITQVSVMFTEDQFHSPQLVSPYAAGATPPLWGTATATYTSAGYNMDHMVTVRAQGIDPYITSLLGGSNCEFRFTHHVD